MKSSKSPKALRWLLPVQLLLIPGLVSAQTAAPAPAAAAAEPPKEEVLVLSPFEVVADNRGYYGANTMSGTRFNTKLEDLASSITIMTKEQMTDLAMTDINDVFLYVAGAEGTGTFTDYTLDRNGSISDNVQLNPAQANRVRGIAPANVSLGNMETMGRVPIDPVGIDSLEISRGPNANVFGLGNPSGTVNQVPSSANLQRNRTQFGLKVDSFDGYRNSLDHNQVILPDKLAIRFQQVFQHEGFMRKPSGVDTERYNGMIKFQPFKNTTVSASYNYYHAYGNRPNSLPPRDTISYWIQNGRPTWDPVAQVIHRGTLTSLPLTAATFPTTANFGTVASPNVQNIDYFSATYLGFNDSQLFVDQNGVGYWTSPNGWPGATPSGTAQTQRLLQTTGTADARGTGVRSNSQPLFLTTPTVSDKSIYDYENLNIAGINRFWDKTETYNVQLDHVFLHSSVQTLAVQANFFREDSERYARNFIGIANDLGLSGQLAIDINEKMLDGTVNPWFLRPYISTDKPRTQYDPARWDTSRVQFAYRGDLTQRTDWLRHLGTHQITGYDEYKYRVNRRYSWRDVLGSSHAWTPAGLYRGNQSQVGGTPTIIPATRSNYRYYVGDNSGNNVDYAPTPFNHGSYPYVWGNAATGVFTRDPAHLTLGAVTDSTGGNNNTKVTIKTLGAVMQSHFLAGRLVTTVGLREDKVYSQFGDLNTRLLADGLTHDLTTTDRWSTTRNFNSGKTKNFQAIVRPFRDAKFIPESGLAHDLLNNLSLGYNKSDSFLPSTPAQTLFREVLPNPTGEDESFSLGLNLFDGKLVIRATRYENIQKDSRNGDASVFNQRVTRIDMSPLGQTPNPARLLNQAAAWVLYQNPGFNATQVRDRVTVITGISQAEEDFLFSPDIPFAATADVVAKGTEIEINYNPTPWWTIAGSVTDSTATNRNVSASIQSWIDERMPIWTTIVDPRIGATGLGSITPTAGNTAGLWWKQLYTGASGNQTMEDNFIAFVGAPYSAFRELEGKANPQGRQYNVRFSTKVSLDGLTDNRLLKKFAVGGAIRWESKGAIGYYGVESLPAKITKLDTNRPIYDGGHSYLDAFVTYKTKMWNDKVNTLIQFNVRNLTESGGLRPVGVYPDGVIHSYRIIDPRQFFLQATFEM